MEYRQFGPTKRKVSVIGEGTWNLERSNKSKAISAMRQGVELGINHIDTAELYGWGAVETWVGEAIADRRDKVFLVSKVVPENASRNRTIAACNTTLAHLGTDHLDCYLLHWRGPHPLQETIDAFEVLKSQGKILSWGVSNFDIEDLEETLKIAGKGKIACNQVLYNLNERSIEHAVIPWCERNDVAVTAYSPFGHGDFPDPGTEEGRTLEAIARAHRATPRQIALAFLTRRPSVFAIPKASTAEHVKENAGAADVKLTKGEIEIIDEAFPRGSSPSSFRRF